VSRCVPAIDRFRIRAIEKILGKNDLPEHYRNAAIAELAKKCRIVAHGCRKRGKFSEAERYWELARSYQEDHSGSR
ncbi:MAG: glycosyltransferase family 2 protein, partial [Deltaproteobacteria bacterium]|nr:glycosyltransferase family 2 protein [Deltaproteobacteria bacterium]